MSKLKDINLDDIKCKLPKNSKSDYWTLGIFIFIVILWVLPSLLQNICNEFYTLLNGYGTAFPAIIGVILLCIIKFDNKPLVSIADACKNGVPFSSLIMCAGTLALGSAMTNENIGLKNFLVDSISNALESNPLSLFVLFLIFIVWATIQTNLSSNMVTATVVTTVAVPILLATGSTEFVLISTVAIGMLSSFAFATPPSMPHIAISCSSNYTNTKQIFIYGSFLAILAIILTFSLGLGIGIVIF